MNFQVQCTPSFRACVLGLQKAFGTQRTSDFTKQAYIRRTPQPVLVGCPHRRFGVQGLSLCCLAAPPSASIWQYRIFLPKGPFCLRNAKYDFGGWNFLSGSRNPSSNLVLLGGKLGQVYKYTSMNTPRLGTEDSMSLAQSNGAGVVVLSGSRLCARAQALRAVLLAWCIGLRRLRTQDSGA